MEFDGAFAAFVDCAVEERRKPGRFASCVNVVNYVAALSPSPLDDRPATEMCATRVEAVAVVLTRVGERFAALRAALKGQPGISALLAAMDADEARLRVVYSAGQPGQPTCAVTGLAAEVTVVVNGVGCALARGDALDFALRVFCYRRFWTRVVEHGGSAKGLRAEFARNESLVDATVERFTR